MRVPDHQLALGQRGQLDLGGRRQRGVAGRRELVHVHPAEQRGAGVAHDAPLHLRAELLRREQHEPEVAAALGEIEQHLPHVGVGAVGRRVLVELVDEHDDVVHAEVAPLEVLAQLGDDAGEDQVLRQRVEPGDVDDVHAPVGEGAPGQIVAPRRRR